MFKLLRSNWKRAALISGVILLSLGGALMIPACIAVGKAPSGDTIQQLQKSKNYKDNQFINGIPAKKPKFFKSLKEWLKKGDHTTAQKPILVKKQNAESLADLSKSGLRITWAGHSTTLVEIEGVRFLIDPIWSTRSSPFSWTGPKRFFEVPFALSNLPPIDAVLISHDHYDHLDMDTVKKLAQKGYRFIVPLGVGTRLQSWHISDDQITELDWWESAIVNGITVTATPARHFSGRSLVMSDRNATLWAGFALAGKIKRLYYTGDTGMFPEFTKIGRRLGPFNATLVEIGAYNKLWADLHLGPEQAVQAVKDARGGLLIPVHWGTFNLAMHNWTEPAERLIVAAKNQNIPIAIPKPGQSVEPAHVQPLSRWWPKLPWQTAEEHPVISSGLSPK